jgi:preprotein translocase subunit SecG
MQNVIFTVHLILALLLIGVVLLQRSEGGGLGIGGGGGSMSGRPPSTPMAKLTWIFGGLFIVTSITLTILAARGASNASVTDALSGEAPAETAPADTTPGLSVDDNLLPPATDDAPAAPPRAEE